MRLEEREAICVEIKKQADARIQYAVSVNGSTLMKTSDENPHCKCREPLDGEKSLAIIWRFTIPTAKAKYELRVRLGSCSGKILHEEKGASSEGGTFQSAGGFRVSFPAK